VPPNSVVPYKFPLASGAGITHGALPSAQPISTFVDGAYNNLPVNDGAAIPADGLLWDDPNMGIPY
jgi:hypothetical protein